MNFQGRQIDPVDLWSDYVEFPPNMKVDGEFLPLVFCPNPDHDNSKSPAFQINVEKGLVHCFGECGISGTYTRAISIIEGCDQRTARKRILKRAGSGSAKLRGTLSGNGNRSRAGSKFGVRDSRATKTPCLDYSSVIPQSGIEYLQKRGIGSAGLSHFDIGFDRGENRIVIPAKDLRGETRFLIKRAVKDSQHPKYLYTEGFPKTSLLFGACHLDPRMIESQGIVVVEGSLDAVKLWQHGIRNVVACLGTGISEIQARILEGFRPSVVFLMLDRDISGIRGFEIARKRLKSPIKACRYPKTKFDPAELTRREAYRSIERAVPISKVLTPTLER